eukprot:gene16770-23045_t
MNVEAGAKAEFDRICETYDILSDPKKKGFYDLYGEDALKDGMPDGKGGIRGGIYQFDPEVTPNQVFARFFGTANPYEALDGISAQFEAMTTYAVELNLEEVFLAAFCIVMRYAVELTLEEIFHGCLKKYAVELTLEEIFHGCLKKVTHKRKVLLEGGEYSEETRHLTIDIKAGLPSGTRFVFEGEGNKTPTKKPGPVVFVLKPAPHLRFARRGADLVLKVTLPLYQALCGTSIEVKTLDQRTLQVPIADICVPGYSTTVVGEGMPKPSGGKGNLILEAILLFPQHISETQKMLLKSSFFLPLRQELRPLRQQKGWQV